jgi:hypothetical protein
MATTRTRTQKTTKTKATVITLKVSLTSRLWRRILIRSDQTLDHLHEAIFVAFEREDDEHLYSFSFPGRDARGRARRAGTKEFLHPYAVTKPEDHDAAETTLADLCLRPGQEFRYVFDFGDSWEHDIVVESVSGEAGRLRYPRITEERGKSPPQYPDPDDLY